MPFEPDAEAFAERIKGAKADLAGRVEALQQQLLEILTTRQALVAALEHSTSPAFSEAVADVRVQLEELVGPSVLGDTPAAVLADLPRFLRAAIYRLEHLQGRVSKDRDQQNALSLLNARVQRLRSHDGASFDDWQKFRFGLEEVRVGVLAV